MWKLIVYMCLSAGNCASVESPAMWQSEIECTRRGDELAHKFGSIGSFRYSCILWTKK
jgi:hypothetical protein